MELKFVRDAITIDDIQGAKPKKLHKENTYVRETNFITDIDGTKPKKDYTRSTTLNPLEVKDINEFRIFKTTRVTNPLQPIYQVQNEENKQENIGPVEGSISRVRHPQNINKDTSLSLKCQDIPGCQIATTGNRYIRSRAYNTYGN